MKVKVFTSFRTPEYSIGISGLESEINEFLKKNPKIEIHHIGQSQSENKNYIQAITISIFYTGK